MFKNIGIAFKLLIVIGVLTLGLIINSLIGFIGFSSALKDIYNLYQGSTVEIRKLANLKDLLRTEQDSLLKILANKTSWTDEEKTAIESNAKIGEIWEDYLKLADIPENSPTQLTIIAHLQPQIKKLNLTLLALLDILKKQNKDELEKFSDREISPLVESIVKEISQAIDGYVEETEQDYKIANSNVSANIFLLSVVFILTLGISIALSIIISSSITRPLNKSVEIINKVAVGETSIQFEKPSNDEIGHLFSAMQAMIESTKKMTEAVVAFSNGNLSVEIESRSEHDILAQALNKMISSAREMSEILAAVSNGDLTLNLEPRSDVDVLGIALANMKDNLKTIIGEIQGEVTAITASAQEIVTSVTEVSTGTAETAAAVAETTTTVEELKQTARISADKAKEVLTNAEETLQIVKISEKSLQDTINDMYQINEKMRIISEGIVKLSEHSKAIEKIIDTVNDLAEQSNLLAVNAAIEAAKAGEQGKSFGVVANEIRTLAEQSKAATIQVRAILNDVQNATSAAVLATEQGSKAVEKGVNQSAQTNESMHTLSKSITRVTQAANQISISSQQQLVGVEQVNIAMTNISEASSQHVEHMKQIETATIALNSVGNNLKEITDQYIITKNQEKFKPLRGLTNQYLQSVNKAKPNTVTPYTKKRTTSQKS